MPNKEKSNYGTFVQDLEREGIYMGDVGIIGIYAMFGILPIIAYILIWIKSFTLQLPKEYYYAKYYLWLLLITSLTSDSVYHYNFLISSVFALYIYQTIYIEQSKMDNDFESQNDY